MVGPWIRNQNLTRHEQVCLIRLRFERYLGPMIGEVSLETQPN